MSKLYHLHGNYCIIDQVLAEITRPIRQASEASALDGHFQLPEIVDSQRTYLDCPFREKDEAHDLGAEWDRYLIY